MAGHLRLVKPTVPTPKGRRRAPTFTPEESDRIRAALKNARGMFGTWACLANAMRLRSKRIETIAHGGTVSADVAVRLARALGKPLESLTRPPSDARACAACGRST
jgi:hypothetical protein